VLDENEKEFNQTILYGLETDDATIVAECKRYPMMANHNVVIVKEAQNIKTFNFLDNYLAQPLDSTILVLCVKHKKFDSRKMTFKLTSKIGVAFESKPIYDNQASQWIQDYLKAKGYFITEKAKHLVAESIGTNLSRLVNELDKLIITEQKGATINEDSVEKCIGISKEFNVFELNNAIGRRDVAKCNLIINHFAANEKAFPIPMIVPSIYKYFTQLIKYLYLTDKSSRNVASELKINPYFVKDFVLAANNYDIRRAVMAVNYLYEADLRSKGVGANNMKSGEILKELLFKILH
jgi:DNA polymerase-3 subunit delta